MGCGARHTGIDGSADRVGNGREVPCRIARTCAGVSDGRAESIRATVPATSGDEKLVPTLML